MVEAQARTLGPLEQHPLTLRERIRENVNRATPREGRKGRDRSGEPNLGEPLQEPASAHDAASGRIADALSGGTDLLSEPLLGSSVGILYNHRLVDRQTVGLDLGVGDFLKSCSTSISAPAPMMRWASSFARVPDGSSRCV